MKRRPVTEEPQGIYETRIASRILGMPIRTQVVAITPPFVAAVIGVFVAIGLLGERAGPVALLLVLLSITWTVAITLSKTTVRVGRDGVETLWLGRRRFTPHHRIVAVTPYDVFAYGKDSRGVSLTLTDGEEVRLPTGQFEAAKAASIALAQAIERARTIADDEAQTVPTEALARSGRTAKDWILELRRLGADLGDMRRSAMPLDALLRVVEDGRATPATRARAAVAALASEDPTAKARIRVASQSTAQPKLRVALERLADAPRTETDAEHEALAADLEALEAVEAVEAREAPARRTPHRR